MTWQSESADFMQWF